MREFNLTEAIMGKPVRTRNGEEARIICFDRRNESYPIVALVGEGEQTTLYTNKGRYDKDRKSESGMDLVMAPNKRWVNLYRNKSGDEILTGEATYDNQKDAELNYDFPDEAYVKIATVPVEWEECMNVKNN